MTGRRPGDRRLDGVGHLRDGRVGDQLAQAPQLLVGELPLALHPGLGAGAGVLEVAEGRAPLLLERVDDAVHLDGDVREGVHLTGAAGRGHLTAHQQARHDDEEQGGDREDCEQLGAHSGVTQHG